MSAVEPPRLRLADPARAFEVRARRLGALAQGHAAGEWLAFLAGVARGQQAAVRDVPVPAARASGDGPPLALHRVPLDPTWQQMLLVIVEAADSPTLPPETRAAIARLVAAGPSDRDALAARLLADRVGSEEMADATLVAAALQAWFVALTGRLEAPAAGGRAPSCPVCGAEPVAGVVDGSTRLRWLACSLCGAEWNVPRLSCVSCGSEERLAYLRIEGEEGAEAEACDACRGYLKLFDREKRPGAEPLADDVATLALDLLLAQDGYRRIGANPWLAVEG